MDQTEQTIAILLGAVTLVGLVGGWWIKRGRPRVERTRHDLAAMRDAVLGRDQVVDSITGKELAPPLPGIGVRMAHQEEQMTLLTSAVARLADLHQWRQKVEGHLEEHDAQIADLKASQMERIITRAESTAAWSAVEAVAKSHPDDEDDEPSPLS